MSRGRCRARKGSQHLHSTARERVRARAAICPPEILRRDRADGHERQQPELEQQERQQCFDQG